MANLIAYSGKVIGGGSDDPRVGDLNTLTTTDKSSVVGAINEVNVALADKSDSPQLIAIVYGDGSKTFAQLLNELYAAYTASGLSLRFTSCLTLSTDVYQLSGKNYFTHHYVTDIHFSAQHVYLGTTSTFYSWDNGTIYNVGNDVAISGYQIALYY